MIAMGLAIAIIIRAKVFGYKSGDFEHAVLVWCDDIQKDGFAKALIGRSCNYNPPYVYLLWLATKLPFDRTLVLKGFSMLCDFVAAAGVVSIVNRITRSRLRALLAGFAVLVAPTVVFNSALWGQCDMAYAAPLVVAVAATLGRRYYLAAALFGLAISVKLQAVFLFPALAVWAIRKEFPWRALLLIPVVFFFALVPAWLAGSPLGNLLLIYPNQMGQYPKLTMSAPTIYVLLPDDVTWVGPFGLWFAFAIIFMVVVACVHTKIRTTAEVLVREAMVFASLTPFLIPHMHERYLFLADVMSVLYCFLFPARFWVALCVIWASLTGYSSFLFGQTVVPFLVAAAAMGLAIVVIAMDLMKIHYAGVFASREPAPGPGESPTEQSSSRTIR
jgi:Gpi18-like mannosyltransferase